MGLKDTLKNAAKAAVAATGDIPVTCVYWSMVSSVYSPSAETIVNKGTKQDAVDFISADFEQKEIDGDKVKREDKKALIPSLNLNFVPKADDRLVVSLTEQWEVENVDTDPAEALWILHIRRATALTIVEA